MGQAGVGVSETRDRPGLHSDGVGGLRRCGDVAGGGPLEYRPHPRVILFDTWTLLHSPRSAKSWYVEISVAYRSNTS